MEFLLLEGFDQKPARPGFRSWSIVESRRYARNKVAHRHVLYLGKINDSRRLAWERTIAVVDERDGLPRQLALFPADRTPPWRITTSAAGPRCVAPKARRRPRTRRPNRDEPGDG